MIPSFVWIFNANRILILKIIAYPDYICDGLLLLRSGSVYMYGILR